MLCYTNDTTAMCHELISDMCEFPLPKCIAKRAAEPKPSRLTLSTRWWLWAILFSFLPSLSSCPSTWSCCVVSWRSPCQHGLSWVDLQQQTGGSQFWANLFCRQNKCSQKSIFGVPWNDVLNTTSAQSVMNGNSVSRGVVPTIRTDSSRQFQRYPTTFKYVR